MKYMEINEEMFEKAKSYFEEGWSLGLSMRKAGFRPEWTADSRVVTHPTVVQLKKIRDKKNWKTTLGPKNYLRYE